MIFRKLAVENAFLTYGIFNLQWVYPNVTPSEVKEDPYLQKGKADSIWSPYRLPKKLTWKQKEKAGRQWKALSRHVYSWDNISISSQKRRNHHLWGTCQDGQSWGRRLIFPNTDLPWPWHKNSSETGCKGEGPRGEGCVPMACRKRFSHRKPEGYSNYQRSLLCYILKRNRETQKMFFNPWNMVAENNICWRSFPGVAVTKNCLSVPFSGGRGHSFFMKNVPAKPLVSPQEL